MMSKPKWGNVGHCFVDTGNWPDKIDREEVIFDDGNEMPSGCNLPRRPIGRENVQS